IGFGDLGQGAGRAAKKLGLNVIAVTRTGKPVRPADVVYPVTRIERALPKADFVIVTTPLTAQTRGLLNRERLALLKPHAGLMNIGRSPVVDYVAVMEMLAKGKLSGAVLDVFDQEPLPPASPVWTTPNLVILPHISCDDPRYIDQLFDTWFANLDRFIAGRKLKNIVDRKLGY
ncbi:MAG: S-adenosyl-L-homocysteine hydrolase, binding domain protein, partial [Betaproteobacteria bacterium]|nr:S-adenosyl-L-homocysteine hydrolase, binding domain protein [Betaproteobacteria bacterium]